MTRVQAWILILLVAIGVVLLGIEYYKDYGQTKKEKAEANALCIQTCATKNSDLTGSAYQQCFNGCLVEAGIKPWEF